MNRRERSMRDESYPRSRRTPSFSSSLLDAIYRSTDQSKSDLDEDSKLGLCKEVRYTTKQANLSHNNNSRGVSLGNYEYGRVRDMNHRPRRTVMVEDYWMEKQSSHSSSECCSSGGFFSTSETETSCKQRSTFTKSDKKKKQKVKQPMSPRSRIANFLSSLFNYGSVKKAKMCHVGAVEDVNFEQKSQSPSVSSSASSYSRRSCMTKTPSSAKKNNHVKRCVRFYPVSIILGEDSHHKYVSENDPDIMPLPSGVGKTTRSSSVDEKKKKKNSVMGRENALRKSEFDFRVLHNHNGEDEEEEDDAFSYSSSDLFELDHLIGAELPVYETTNLETNKAIANGLHL